MTRRYQNCWQWLCLIALLLANASGSAIAQEAETEEPALHAIVLLLDAPREMTQADISGLVAQALDTEIDPDDPDAIDWVVGDKPTFVAQVAGQQYLINVIDTPYIDDKDAVAEGLDPELGAVILRHNAWLSIDLLGDFDVLDDDEAEQAYRNLGRLAAELLDEDVCALYATYSGDILPYAPGSETTELLTQMHPLLVIAGITEQEPPIVNVEADDPRMLAAVATARDRWPEFVDAYDDRRPDDAFIVKFGFATGNPDMENEFMWLQVASINGDSVTGILDNEPAYTDDVAYGDRVTRPVSEINDWLIIRDGEWTGGFTIEVLRQAQENAQASDAEDSESEDPSAGPEDE